MVKSLEMKAADYQIARQSYVQTLDQRRHEALSRGDSVKYFQLCNEMGITLDNIEDNLLYERGYLDSKGEELDPSLREFSSRGRVPKHVYQEVIKQAGVLRVKPWSILEDISSKRKILSEVMGYNQLRTGSGYTPIEECNDSRIGQAFKKSYIIACRAVGLKY